MGRESTFVEEEVEASLKRTRSFFCCERRDRRRDLLPEINPKARDEKADESKPAFDFTRETSCNLKPRGDNRRRPKYRRQWRLINRWLLGDSIGWIAREQSDAARSNEASRLGGAIKSFGWRSRGHGRVKIKRGETQTITPRRESLFGFVGRSPNATQGCRVVPAAVLQRGYRSTTA